MSRRGGTRDGTRGRSGGRRIADFDPAALNLSGWIRAAYPGPTSWPGTASAGASGSRNFTQASNAPAVGANLNGRATASFVAASSHYLASTAAFVTVSAGTIVALINTTSRPADAAQPYLEGAVANDSGANLYLAVSASGARAGYHDGVSWKNTAYQAISNGTWAALFMRWNGTQLQFRVNGAAWSSVSVGNVGALGANFHLARNVSGGTFLDGLVAEVMFSQATFDDATCNGILSYLRSRHGVSLP